MRMFVYILFARKLEMSSLRSPKNSSKLLICMLRKYAKLNFQVCIMNEWLWLERIEVVVVVVMGMGWLFRYCYHYIAYQLVISEMDIGLRAELTNSENERGKLRMSKSGPFVIVIVCSYSRVMSMTL